MSKEPIMKIVYPTVFTYSEKRTINLGNYESRSIQAGVSAPIKTTKDVEKHKRFVKKILDVEEEKIRAELARKETGVEELMEDL